LFQLKKKPQDLLTDLKLNVQLVSQVNLNRRASIYKNVDRRCPALILNSIEKCIIDGFKTVNRKLYWFIQGLLYQRTWSYDYHSCDYRNASVSFKMLLSI